MKDSLTSTNARDFQQRYNGTFGWYLGDGSEPKRILVQLTNVSTERVTFTDAKGAEYYASADSNIQFEFIPIDKGFFNIINGGTAFLSRTAARQWSRGISSSNTALQLLLADSKASVMMAQVLSIGIMDKVFNSTERLQARCVAYLSEPTHSVVALSKHFALAGKDVYFYNRIIGKVARDVITLDNPLLYQELSDAVRRNTLPFQVVNG